MPLRRDINHFLLHFRALEDDENESSKIRRQGKAVADILSLMVPNVGPLLSSLDFLVSLGTPTRSDEVPIREAIRRMQSSGSTHPTELVDELVGE